MAHTQEKIKIIFFEVLLIKMFVLIINLARKLFFREKTMLLTYLLKQFMKIMIKKAF